MRMSSEKSHPARELRGFGTFLRGFLERVEGRDIPLWALAAYCLALISIREGIEQIFFEKPFELYLFYHHAFFFLATLAAGILVLSLWVRTDVVRTARVVALGYAVIILPPLIDRLAFHRVGPYAYASPDHFLRKALTFFWNEPGLSKGILIEGVAVLFMSLVYVLLKTKSAPRTIGASLSLYGIFALGGTPRLLLPFLRLRNEEIFQSRHVLYFSAYFMVFLILGLVGLYLRRRKLLRAAVREMLSFRSAHFVIMVSAGVYFNAGIRAHPFPGLLYGLIAVLLVLILWLVALLLNNAYDLDIDRISDRGRPLVLGWATPGEYLRLGGALAVLALFSSGILGAKASGIITLFILSAYVYSVPPFRLRLRLGSNLIIGWGSFLVFYLGYFAWTAIRDIPRERVPALVSLIILGALCLGSFTKDAKDYEGDLKAGIRTVFTVYGPKKGGRIAAVCLFVSILTPLLLFRGAVDILFFLFIAVLTAILFEKSGRLIVPFAGYAVAFIYAVLRTTGVLG
jgi:4-hydroxybenzoate polyprenyltransferase